MDNVRVAVLNSDFTFINFISWERAMTLIHKGKAEAIKYADDFIRSFSGVFRIPLVLKLVKLARLVYKKHVPFSKRAVFIRDDFTCAYCGERCKDHPTLDHVIPQSRGGLSTWENTVCACRKCNARKGSMSTKEAHMHLRFKPFQPTIQEFLQKRLAANGVKELLADLFANL